MPRSPSSPRSLIKGGALSQPIAIVGETHLKKDSPGREKRNGDAGVGGHIAYSIAYATDLNKRGPALSLQVI